MKLSRPPFILTFPGDMAGCGYHRVMRPLEIMSRSGMASGRVEVQFPSDHILKAMKPDVIVWQRQTDIAEIMDRYRAALPDAFFVFEIDDALSAVPEASWHNPFMTPNIDSKLAATLTKMDAITVTTQDLADHMRSIAGSSIPIRVVPNMLGRDDFEIAFKAREEVKKNTLPSEKFRVGFGGGVSHAGDIALLNEVFPEFGDEVEWCFLGMDPKLPPNIKKTYFGGVAPNRYLPSLAALNVDLIIAPLEENLFNRCKSNLRLLESGACGYPVIASPVSPYFTDNPPIYKYCETPSEWTAAIRTFMKKPLDERLRHGQKMRDWAISHYDMDEPSKCEKRLLGWLPDRTRVFKPRLNSKGSSVRTVHTAEEFKTAMETSEDILYVRPGIEFSPEAEKRLLSSDLDVACGLTNDGGPWGFPSQAQFSQIESGAIEGLIKSIADLDGAKTISLSSVSGPAVLVRRSGLDVLGLPDFDSFSPEVAILEWSCGARTRGLKIGLCPNVYTGVPSPSIGTQGEAETATLRITSRWPSAQSDDAALKALREHLEIVFHRDCYRSLPPAQRNDYRAWVDFCDTRGPAALARALDWQDKSERPVIQTLNYPQALNDWERLADAEWFFFVPSDSKLPLDYYQILMLAIEQNPDAKIIYGDHDYTFQDQARLNPDFKPNFDPHLLLCRDYVTQALAIRADVLREWLPFGEINEATLYQTVLSAVQTYGRECVAHCARILVTVPPMNMEVVMQYNPMKLNYAERFITKMDWRVRIENHPTVPLIRSISYADRIKDHEPTVSIIIPCKDNIEMLAPCVATILKMTNYPKDRFEIVIMDNGSTRAEMTDYLRSLLEGEHCAGDSHPRIKIIPHPHKYNWSEINNVAVRKHTSGQYLCFLNDDTRVMAEGWLSEMVGAASMPEIGAVGARLIYPNGHVQHVGVVAQCGLTGHIHKGLAANLPGIQGYAITSHESTAVTGACLVISRQKFELVNGFYEGLPTNFNDVAFCQDLFFKHGLKNLVCYRAELQHFEGVTRNAGGMTEERWNLINSEGKILFQLHPEPDPYWNPNLMIAWIQEGKFIAGMDLQAYKFPVDPALPWVDSVLERVLVIGDVSAASNELHDHAAIYQLSVWGNSVAITSPPMRNCGPWDIRRPDIAKLMFERLGISRVILTQLGEAPVQLLSFLRRLNLPIEYRPVDAESICPRGNLIPNGQSCNEGYKRGQCQACMDEYSSPQGNVLIPAWLSEWVRFVQEPVTVDLSQLKKPEYREALEFTFSGSSARTSPTASHEVQSS